MKKKLLNFWLLTLMVMLGGSNAWAQTTTLLEYGTADVAWSAENLAEWTAGGSPTITDGYVGISGGNGSYATSKTIEPTANAIINVQAVWRAASSTGRAFSAGNGSYFRFGNIIVAQNDQDKKHGYGFAGLNNIGSATLFSAGSYRTDIANCTWLLIEMEINTASNTVTSFSVKSEDGNTTYASAADVVLADADYTTVAFGYQKSGSVKNTNVEQLKSIKITQTVQAVETADYTVKYVCDGAEIKDAAVRTGVVGQAIALTEADTQNFYNTDGSKKYIYVSSDVEGKTVSEGAVVTVTFREAEKFAWTAKSNVGAYTISGETFEGDKASVTYPLYQLVKSEDGEKADTLWTKGATSSTFAQNFDVTENNQELTLTYTKTEIPAIFYAEIEDIEGMGIVASGNAAARSSQRAAGYSASGNTAITTLPQGKYKFFARFYSPTSAGGKYNFFTGNRNIWEATTGNANATDLNTEVILANESNEILLGQCGATAAVDFIYIQKLTDPTAAEIDSVKTADQKADSIAAAAAALAAAKDALKSVIDAAKTIDTTDKKGAEDLANAISDAETALAAEGATVESLGAAKTALEEAIDAFNRANPYDPMTAIANVAFDPAAEPLGWTAVTSEGFKDFGMYQIGGEQMVRFAAPTADDTHLNTEFAAGLECRWSGNFSSYTQDVTLPAGAYELSFDVENVNAATTAATYNNLFNVKVGDAIYVDEKTEWMSAKSAWTTHTIKFILTQEATATISFGYGTGENNIGADNTPALYVSHVKMSTYDPLADAKATLQDEITKAEALKATEGYTAGVETFAAAIDAAKNSLASATTQEELETALATLKAAEEAFVKTNLIAANAAKVEGASLENPVAAPFVVNGTFDENTNGWTCTGGFQNKALARNQAGAFTVPFFENWNPDAKVNKMYQVIENIPNGVYKLNIAAFVNTLANPNESQFVFANKDSVFLTTGEPTMYEVYTKVENNTLEIGLEQITATANWMGIDNVSLTYFGAETTVDQVKNAGFLKEVKDVLAAKTSVKTKRALQDAYDAYVAAATAETKAALEAALATAKVSANSYKILETGSLPDNSLEGWTCTNTQTFHINTWSTEGNSDGTGMTTPFIENWCNNSGVLGTGEIYYSLPGLDPGVYQFSALIRAYSEAGNEPTGASLFAGDREKPFNTGKRVTFNNNALIGIYDTYAMACEVGEDGVFKFGIKIAEDRNFNWMAFKSCKVAYVGGAIDADAVAELAKTMPEGKMNAEVKTAAETAIATATATPNLDNYEAAAKAIAAAQASVTAYEKAKTVLEGIEKELESTNVYTAEAFKTNITDNWKAYNEGTLTDEQANGLDAGSRTTGILPSILLSAYTSTVEGTPYINTWSVEGDNDGSNFKTPFYEYWTGDGNSLAADTITAKVEGLEAGEYEISAWVRVRIKNGAEAPATSISLTTATDTAAIAGTQIGTTPLYMGEYKVTATVAEDGILTFSFNVAAEGNVSWLSFKNVKFEKKATPQPAELAQTLNVERYPGMGYGVTEATVDFTEAKAFLGVDAVTTDMLRIVNPDGTMIDDYAPFDGWFNGEGVAEGWGQNTKVCVKFFQAIPEGKFEICDMNAADEVGKTYTVKWALVANEKQVTYTINVQFVEKPVITLTLADLNKVDEKTVALTSELGQYYEDLKADVDVAAILTKLGVESLNDLAIYAVQSDGTLDDSYKVGTTDGWRNAAGDWQGWGDDAYFFVKADFSQASAQIYSAGGMDGKNTNTADNWQNPPTYTATYAFVKNNDTHDAVILKVTLTYTIPTGINAIARDGQKNTIFNLNGQKMNKAQKGLYIINGKKVVIK